MADKIVNFGWLNWIKRGFLIALFLSSGNLLNADLVDLEKFKSEFVLETKKIEIPNHPEAFNASIVSWRGSLILSFRELPLSAEAVSNQIYSSSISRIGLVFLNSDFAVDGEAYILEIPGTVVNGELLSRAEDARLINVDERLYIVYSDNRDEEVTEGRFRMYVGELDFDGRSFSLKSLERLEDFPGESSIRREKNWVPFDYRGNLFLSYSISPHLVFEPFLDDSGSCDFVSLSTPDINWNWGEIRGGTPALRIGSKYLAFFHSSIDMVSVHSEGDKALHYFIGAYTFEKDAPFRITHVSKEPIIGENFYHGKKYPYYWKPVQAVFPCGFVYDGEFIYLSYGRQDHEIWIAKLDREKLLESLIEVTEAQL
jgi:predicted GH43/DUF377 family glycosyl hydrolase